MGPTSRDSDLIGLVGDVGLEKFTGLPGSYIIKAENQWFDQCFPF